MGSILAKKIFQNNALIFSRPGFSAITSEQVNSAPVTAWLVRNPYCCGGDEELQLTFQQPASNLNVIKGVWIQAGDQAYLIDGNVDDVVTKLNGCCGTNAQVVQNYAAGLPAWQAPVAKTYTVSRIDDGSVNAITEAQLAYTGEDRGNVLPNSFSRTAYNSGTGVSTYVFQAYSDPRPQGADTIAETARVFDSNSYATALTGGNFYRAAVSCDGDVVTVKGTAQTFASLVTALQADPIAGAMGTWSTSATKVTLTTTVRDAATIVLDQAA
jgi:hypothetical protein